MSKLLIIATMIISANYITKQNLENDQFVENQKIIEIQKNIREEKIQEIYSRSDELRVLISEKIKAEDIKQKALHQENEKQKKCLAAAIYFEARGEKLLGQIAVGEVILTRTKSSIYPQKICDVVKQRKQFSFVKNGVIPNVPKNQLYKKMELAQDIMNGEVSSPAKNSMHFHANYVKPNWAKTKNITAQIGNHIFYKQ